MTWSDVRDFVLMFLLTILVGLVLLIASARCEATPYAVVRIPSHGCSGTVIATARDSTWILSCAHAFAGASLRQPISVDAPTTVQRPAAQVGVRLLRVDAQSDLSLIFIGVGPWPYVAPVAPAGWSGHSCWSVGYDEMRLPATLRPCAITGRHGDWVHTRERPWHGRSGGGLLDPQTGQLVGVVSGYTGPPTQQELHPSGHGVYVSHTAVRRFLTSGGRDGARLPPGRT